MVVLLYTWHDISRTLFNVAYFHVPADVLGTKCLSVFVRLTLAVSDEVSFTNIGQLLLVSACQSV